MDRAVEQALIQAILKGDERAFGTLVSNYQHKVFSLCARMLGNKQEAEDVAQEVFISVFRHVSCFRFESSLSTWILRITRNCCLNRLEFLQRRGRGKCQEFDVNSDRPPGAVSGAAAKIPCAPAPDELLSGKQLEVVFEREMTHLSAEHRELIVLRDLEQQSYEEIQAITGLAIGTIKSRLHRARMELARRMAPYLGDE